MQPHPAGTTASGTQPPVGPCREGRGERGDVRRGGGYADSYLGVIVGPMAMLGAAAIKAVPAAAVAAAAAVTGRAERTRRRSGPGRATEGLRRALALVLQ